MVGIDLGSPTVWLIILALGVGCFALRVSFIQLHGWLIEFPPVLEESLEYLPPAILAGLAASFLLIGDGSIVTPVLDVPVIAAVAAGIVAWRTESMLATVVVGMGTLWGLHLLIG